MLLLTIILISLEKRVSLFIGILLILSLLTSLGKLPLDGIEFCLSLLVVQMA